MSQSDLRQLPEWILGKCNFFVTLDQRPAWAWAYAKLKATPNVGTCMARDSNKPPGGKLCAVTWNVGSEDNSGIGQGGIVGEHLYHALGSVVTHECSGASVVAVSLQEGAEKAVTEILKRIGSEMQFEGKKLELRVSTFAGKPAWDRGDPTAVDGFTQHTSLPIKAGTLLKERQYMKRLHERYVVLTSRQLLTYEKGEDAADFSKAATNYLWIPLLSYQLDSENHCLSVQGKEGRKSEPNKQTVVKFKLCASDASEINEWHKAIKQAEEQAFQSSMQPGLPFHNGVSLAILSTDAPTDIKLYTVDFSKIACNGKPCTNLAVKIYSSAKRKARRTFTPTTADKGAAIARVVLNGKAICFAACHLDASKHETRAYQATQIMLALSTLECDAEVWMGDFNTRPTMLHLPSGKYGDACCPWPEVELAVSHMAPKEAREAVLKVDDMGIMVPPDRQYKEMPIKFPATFHKRYRRAEKDQCKKLPTKGDNPQSMAARLVTQAGLMTHDTNEQIGHPYLAYFGGHEGLEGEETSIQHILQANEFWKASKSSYPCKPSSDILCWAGSETRESCQASGCFNTHKASHCPGYTDRIIFKPGDGVLEPCSYSSFQGNPIAALADHNPVIASFKLGVHTSL